MAETAVPDHCEVGGILFFSNKNDFLIFSFQSSLSRPKEMCFLKFWEEILYSAILVSKTAEQ